MHHFSQFSSNMMKMVPLAPVTLILSVVKFMLCFKEVPDQVL